MQGKFLPGILLLAFFLRLIFLGTPSFTADEARVAYRGYTLSVAGRDELGRRLPFIFNSSSDFDLPAVSYITALGVLLFGKNDFGARIPFILLGTATVYLSYLLAKRFNSNLGLLTALVMAISPGLIYVSRFPNEAIVLLFCLELLLYYLTSTRLPSVKVVSVMLFTVLISKLAWFILPVLFLLVACFIGRTRKYYFMLVTAIFLSLTSFVIFTNIPNGQRSLGEHNLSLFNDITIKNGINKLRGEGIGLSRVLFSKANLLPIGLLHWLSGLNPKFYFGQFDPTGKLGLTTLGVWPSIFLIPFIIGISRLFILGKKGYLVLALPLVITWPAALIYPEYNLNLTVLTLPALATIIALGWERLKNTWSVLIAVLTLFQLFLWLINYPLEIKNSSGLRPVWVREMFANLKTEGQIFSWSDELGDLLPYFEWFSDYSPERASSGVVYPYKYQVYTLPGVEIAASGDVYRYCKVSPFNKIWLGDRTLDTLQNDVVLEIKNQYKDSLGQVKAFQLSNSLCLK